MNKAADSRVDVTQGDSNVIALWWPSDHVTSSRDQELANRERDRPDNVREMEEAKLGPDVVHCVECNGQMTSESCHGIWFIPSISLSTVG